MLTNAYLTTYHLLTHLSPPRNCEFLQGKNRVFTGPVSLVPGTKQVSVTFG